MVTGKRTQSEKKYRHAQVRKRSDPATSQIRRKKDGDGFSRASKPNPASQTHLPGPPPLIYDLISSYIRKKTGKEIDDPGFLEKLRQSVMAQKASYWHDRPGRSIKYGRAYDIFAYLAYHLPVYFTQFRSILQELDREGLLAGNPVLLDIGTGPGVVPLAIIDIWKGKGDASLEIYALERSEEHREAYKHLIDAYALAVPHISVHPPLSGDLVQIAGENRSDLPEKVNLITFQNVLAELEGLNVREKASIVIAYAERLSEDGLVIIVEPAEMRHATTLRMIQRELVAHGLYVYAPCSFPWGITCRPTTCWTFQQQEPILPSPLMILMAGQGEEYRFYNTDIKYSFLILSKKPVSRCSYRIPPKSHMVRLSDLERYPRRVIHVTGALMSGDIGNRGMHIYKICDGTCQEPVYAVLSGRNRRPGHSALMSGSYGQVFTFHHVQVRRHKTHDAWNLIIMPDTRIEKVLPEIRDYSCESSVIPEMKEGKIQTQSCEKDRIQLNGNKKPEPSGMMKRRKKTGMKFSTPSRAEDPERSRRV